MNSLKRTLHCLGCTQLNGIARASHVHLSGVTRASHEHLNGIAQASYMHLSGITQASHVHGLEFPLQAVIAQSQAHSGESEEWGRARQKPNNGEF